MANDQDINSGDFDWMHMDRIDGIWWGAAFVWGALVLFFANVGWPGTSSWWDSGGVFFVGIGAFALVCAAIRFRTPGRSARSPESHHAALSNSSCRSSRRYGMRTPMASFIAI